MSRFNPIKRLCSFVNGKIATVIIPDGLAGEKPADNDEEGWLKVLDNAVEMCVRFRDKKST